MARTYTITAEEAKKSLSYDPDTGVFTWLERRMRSAAGSVAGSVHPRGYRRIGVRGSVVYAHRLAWVMHYGKEPVGEIDHINGIKDDNRIANLRDVPQKVNNQNKRESSLAGVVPSINGQWCATFIYEGRVLRIGTFATQEEAAAMRLHLKKKLFEGCAHW